ncbi:hypothetical protein CPB83DRAFT_641078 [Crepidotus variabilis]|uniref:DUF7702 domain-containing protein n=1 Tax=Crepidotus variabilis TaxID=179855 RepID=A0A9P6E7U0_9AGAR|nr:hypothetical protein CPB83DRAFT_641078 [Crepidotus variabilis]
MPQLDLRGKIAAAEIAFWVPVFGLSAYLVFRYAFRRDAGWFFLTIFSAVRIAEGALVVAAEMMTKRDLFSAAYIIDYAALFALLFASLGFVGMAGQHTYSENPRVATILRVVGAFGLVGLALCLAGGVLGAKPDAANQTIPTILRRAGVCIYAAVYLFLFATHIGTWTYRWHLRSYRRSLLFGISVALPFLGARIAYAVISAWSSEDLYGDQLSSNKTLANLNPIKGNWILYLVLGPIMEYCVAAIYLFSSTILASKKHRY